MMSTRQIRNLFTILIVTALLVSSNYYIVQDHNSNIPPFLGVQPEIASLKAIHSNNLTKVVSNEDNQIGNGGANTNKLTNTTQNNEVPSLETTVEDFTSKHLHFGEKNQTATTTGSTRNFTNVGQLMDDLDLTHPSCGFVKCFYSNKTDPTIGWLAAHETMYPPRFFKLNTTRSRVPTAMMRGWKLAQELEIKFDIRHFLLEAPQLLPKLRKRERHRFNLK